MTTAPPDRESLLYRALAHLLFYGVIASLALMVVGYALLAIRHETSRHTWLPLPDVIPHALSGDPRRLLDLGVLALFATPTLRVVAAIALFAAERQRRYVVISTLVLLLLGVSVAVALLKG